MGDYDRITNERAEELRSKAVDAHIKGRETMAAHTGRWESMDEQAASALRATGQRPEANRIQTWAFDQGDVWVNLYGEHKQLTDMDEPYLLAVIAFLYRNTSRFARIWIADETIRKDTYPKGYRIDYARIQLANNDPYRWMTTSKLVCSLWYHVFSRRGRVGNGSEHVED